jgi:hypothetical protein
MEEREVEMLSKSGTLLSLSLMAASVMFAAQETWTGKISDSMCGANHQAATEHGGKKMTDRECTLACIKHGAKYVVVHDGKVYDIANQDAPGLEANAGRTVRVTGDVEGDTITISKIEAAGHRKG